MAGLSAYIYLILRRGAMTEEMGSIQVASSKAASDIDKYLVNGRRAVEILSLNTRLADLVRKTGGHAAEDEALHRWLLVRTSIFRDCDMLYVLNPLGLVEASTDPGIIGQNYSFRPYFKEAMAGQNHMSDWTIGLSRGTPGIYLSAPIIHGMENLGVLVMKLKVEGIRDSVLRQGSAERSRDAFLLNGAGVILVHSRPELELHSLDRMLPQDLQQLVASKQFAGHPIRSLGLPELRDTARKAAASARTELCQYRFRQDPQFASLSPLKEQDWILGVTVPVATTTLQLNRLLRHTLLLSLVSFVLAGTGAALLSRRLALPIVQLTETVNRFAGGNGAARADSTAGNEVGRLAASFNAMADTITEHTRLLEAAVRERTLELEQVNGELLDLSVTDPLTGCFNRRQLQSFFEGEISRAQRSGRCLSVIMCDLDHFKRVNDTYGHLMGDEVIRTFSGLLLGLTRNHVDRVIRYGGEEFLLLLPETDLMGAMNLAERLRVTLAETVILLPTGDPLRVTASFGVITAQLKSPARPLDANALALAADTCLYRAKDQGRNRVEWQEL